MKRFVFGYGSLVNTRTHDYPAVHPARVQGWKRRWCHAHGRQWAFLAATPVDGAQMDGVIAEVPGTAWDDLDTREYSYDRIVTRDVEHPLVEPVHVQHYWVPHDKHVPPEAAQPILLSYLDVCVEGFLEVFGDPGPDHFFGSTEGWEAPVLDDRAAPIYRRHTAPGPAVRAITDTAIARLGVQRLSLSAVMKELE